MRLRILCVFVLFSFSGCSGMLEAIKKSAGKRYRVSVLECLVAPLKANGRRWDFGLGSFSEIGVAAMTMSTPIVGKISSDLVADIKQKGDPTTAPDLCVVVRTSKGASRTEAAGDSYHATWYKGFHIRAKDSDRFKIEVYDLDDLSDHDLVGVTSVSVNEALQSGGLLRLSSFGQVVELTIEIVQD